MAWEGLKTGLASIFGKDDPQWKDKGKGHKLGEGAPKAAKAGEVKTTAQVRKTSTQGPVQPPPPPQPLIPAAERTSRASNPSTTTGSPRGMPPVSVGRRASGSDAVQSAVLERVVMANTPTGAEMAGLGTHLSLCRRPEGESREGSPLLTGMEGLLNTPTAAERNMGLGVSRPSKDQDFHLQQCLCMIVSQDEAAAQVSLALLYKLLRNVLSNPMQPKYRSVRMGNPAIQAGIVNMRGAMEFLDALGFTTIFQPVTQPAASSGAAQQPGGEGPQQGGAAAVEGHLRVCPARSISQQEDRPASPLSAARSISQRPLGHMTEEEGQAGHSYMLDNQQGQADAALEGYLVLPEEASLHPLTVGVHELITVMGALGMDLADTPTQSPPVAISSSSTNVSLRSDISSPTQPAASVGGAAAAALGSPTTSTQGGGSSKLVASKPQAQQQPTEAPIDRQTQVVLPVAPDTQVPDWVFERTGADLKAEVAALARKRAAGEILATRAWRERAAAAAAGSGAAAAPQTVTLRVRFPEGICLQGCFGVREPVTRIFEWVTESLRYMEISYELITPSRKPLPSAGLIRDQPDLKGPAILNFRTLGGDLQAFSHVCHLSDAMLRQTYAE